MRSMAPVGFSVAMILAAGALSDQRASAAVVPVKTQFVGSTPCDRLPRRFIGIPERAACERITWRVSLSGDTASARTGAFTAGILYGVQVQNGPGLVGGGTSTELRGTWTSEDASRRHAGRLYRLTVGRSSRAMSFATIGQNLLHPLGDRGELLAGNSGWSYTLSRSPLSDEPDATAAVSLPAASTSTPASQTAAGVFEGRTACRDLARQLGASVGNDCTKLKWALTLRVDRGFLDRGTYILEGTLYRSAPRVGGWTRVPHLAVDGWSIYRLDDRAPGGSISLLQPDDGVLFFLAPDGRLLVGDESYSYTLNRVDTGPGTAAKDRLSMVRSPTLR